ncbi:DMT family transporter [Desulforhopalus sp. IMCC35007]|uniref:DMT family transporter n=1 Tax=Desulforhopalus sp. IMCC35007 TaxID=2569543 RepID=UPI0010AE263C|nr:DMT family transporter [Desulforhopalus sp. IMCC35007]TKB11811.1 DMT family transporter [Desulforhopalus sp. IMCC35007]
MNSNLLLKDTDGKELPLDAALFTVFLCILFGANAVAIKISFTGIGVFTSIGLRFSIAATALLLWAWWKKKPLRINKKQVGQQLIISTVFFLQMSWFYHGQNQTTASHGTLISNILPFVVMVLAHFILQNDRISRKKFFGLIFGFCGVLLLFFDKAGGGGSSVTGDLMIFVAVLHWGFNVVYIKKIIQDYHALQITIYPMFFTIPLFFISALIWDDRMIIFPISSEVILSILYQSLVTASFGFIMWNTLIKKYGATALHSFVFIMPISGVFFGILLLGEPLTSTITGSILLVSAGLVVVNYKGHRGVISP